MSYGLTPQGFRRRRYADVISAMETRARSLFGENVNLTDRSPLGIIIRVIAWSMGILWQVAEAVYNSAFVDTATGVDLDRVALYIGIVRRPAARATGEATFTGTDTTIIPEGFRLETPDGVQFRTTVEAEIDGATDVPITAVDAGTVGNVPAETITEIVAFIAGIDSVANVEATSGGQERETDAEFRARYALSVAKGGASTVDSIRASLLELDGVRGALVVENNRDTTDGEGRPPKSFQCYVLGGDESEIAHTILQTKAAGIQAYGTDPTDAVIVEDDAGQEHSIGFTYAEEVPIYVHVAVTSGAEFPPDGLDQIRTAIIRYISGQDEDGQVYAGLMMGQDVIYARLIQACYAVFGVEDVLVTVSESDDPSPPEGTSNIPISLTEAPITDHEKVVVVNAD